MLKKVLLSAVFCIAGYITFAQNVDSVTLVHAKWKKQKFSSKLKLITCHFDKHNLFSANENISYLELKNNGRLPFAVGYEQTVLKKTSTFGTENHALAAINGSFFDVKNGGSVDFIKVQGKIISENKLDKNNNRARHQQAAIEIHNGKLTLTKWDGSMDWENKLTAENILLTGPLLTYHTEDQDLDTTAFTRSRHPRSCIGIKADGKIILLTVDGRNENSAGMSLPELSSIMHWLGCITAINLDGGGSTTLWVQGFQENGVVNYPTDNKKWDHEGERKVANVIFIKPKP